MGVCTSDPLNHLIKTHGNDVSKFIVSIKSQQFIQQTTPKLIQRIQEQIKFKSHKVDDQFDKNQLKIKQYYSHIENQIKNSYEKNKKKIQEEQIQQHMTYNHIIDHFNQLKSQKNHKLKLYQKNLINKIQSKKHQQQQLITQKRPKLQQYENMTNFQKNTVLKNAEEKYTHQIKQNNQKILKNLQNSVKMNTLQNDLNQVSGLKEVEKLVKQSRIKFDKGKRQLTPVVTRSGLCCG